MTSTSHQADDDKYPGVITYESKTGFTSSKDDQHFALTVAGTGVTTIELTDDSTGDPEKLKQLAVEIPHNQCVTLFRFYFDALEKTPGGVTDMVHSLKGFSHETLRMLAAKCLTNAEILACRTFLRKLENQGGPAGAFLAHSLSENCSGDLSRALITLLRAIDGGPRR